jgi:hypothetical protein
MVRFHAADIHKVPGEADIIRSALALEAVVSYGRFGLLIVIVVGNHALPNAAIPIYTLRNIRLKYPFRPLDHYG